ncbi:MAG: hypothetical protein JWO22_2036 [Frankiales bacterium]|nr:hypothetical protein [Frankiales bacterium]
MATGNRAGDRSDGLSVAQQERIEHTVSLCRSQNGLDVSVLVGDLNTATEGFREAAETLHAALGERAHSAVLVVVAPGQRKVEVVTGPSARRRVPDRVAALAVLSMTSAFGGGDLAGGVIDGLRQMADAAGKRPGIPAPPEPSSTAVVAHH